VSFSRDRVIVLIIEFCHTCIVPEDGDDPAFLIFDGKGRSFDAGLEEIVDFLSLPGREIQVLKETSEGIVVAVVAPRLGYVFQFNVCRKSQSQLLPLSQNIFSQEVLPNSRYIPFLKGKVTFKGDPFQLFIAANRDEADSGFMVKDDLGQDISDSLALVPSVSGLNPPQLDNVIGENFPGDALYLNS